MARVEKGIWVIEEEVEEWGAMLVVVRRVLRWKAGGSMDGDSEAQRLHPRAIECYEGLTVWKEDEENAEESKISRIGPIHHGS